MLEAAKRQNNKILAIEDDPDVLALYKSYLQKRGYEVLSASGAVEGISLLQSNPDTRLILLDLNLPGMSGEEWI
ncbi:MAG TPA: response regulator, partial [Thermoanaerobaculia bacterium]